MATAVRSTVRSLCKELLNSSSNSLPLSYGLLIVAAPLSVAGRLDGLADKFADWFRRICCVPWKQLRSIISFDAICRAQVALEDIVAWLMAGAPLESLLGELCSTFSLGSVFILISFQLAWWAVWHHRRHTFFEASGLCSDRSDLFGLVCLFHFWLHHWPLHVKEQSLGRHSMGMREFPCCVPEPYPSVQEVATVNTIIHPKNHALAIPMCVCPALLRNV